MLSLKSLKLAWLNYAWLVDNLWNNSSSDVDLLTGLIPPYVCAYPKSGAGFPTSYVVVFFVQFSVSLVKMRGGCSFCLYWWNWWLFKLSFYNRYLADTLNQNVLFLHKISILHLLLIEINPSSSLTLKCGIFSALRKYVTRLIITYDVIWKQ